MVACLARSSAHGVRLTRSFSDEFGEMTAIPLLSGTLATPQADFTMSYPINLEPVPMKSGISEGYLRAVPGADLFATGAGADRGGFNWNEQHYRVMGTKLIQVSSAGLVTILGDVGAGGPVAFDNGFGTLAINSGSALYYWNGTTLTQVTDPNLGPVNDMLWLKGQYFTTDGTSIVVTQLADPMTVDPLKYGSAEEDPDPIVALFKMRGEFYALGSFTIQVYAYSGGSGFPLTSYPTATVPVGVVGRGAKCRFYKTLAFVGQEKEDGGPTAPAVYLLEGGDAPKISTRAIDDELAKVDNLGSITMESRVSRDERRLLIHLPTKTLVYCANASRIAGEAVWYILRSGLGMNKPYRLRNAVFCYGKWIVGDYESANLGILNDSLDTQYGEPVGWQFDTMLTYNGGKGAILHDAELVGLPGRQSGTGDTSVFMSMTNDGETFSLERACSQGRKGDRTRRVQWRPHRRFRLFMGMRFRGSALTGWAGCNATLEGLSV